MARHRPLAIDRRTGYPVRFRNHPLAPGRLHSLALNMLPDEDQPEPVETAIRIGFSAYTRMIVRLEAAWMRWLCPRGYHTLSGYKFRERPPQINSASAFFEWVFRQITESPVHDGHCLCGTIVDPYEFAQWRRAGEFRTETFAGGDPVTVTIERQHPADVIPLVRRSS